MAERRTHDLKRFYDLLYRLESVNGGKCKLGDCNQETPMPTRGVYFFFEEGERRSDSGSGLRVVRVGTHGLNIGGKTTLWTRISKHKGDEDSEGGNHRNSVFRLLVGASMLRRDGRELNTWGVGDTAPQSISVDEVEHEQEVTRVVRRMPLLWLEVPDESGPNSLRGVIERNSIALLSNYKKTPLDKPSKGWLGLHSNREKVRNSGLWNSNHVEEPYDPAFLETFESLLMPVPSGPQTAIIQCAGSKALFAGSMRTREGKPVEFVADPRNAPINSRIHYAHPDDVSDTGRRWRDELLDYNAAPGDNPLRLFPAWRLYQNPAYAQLVRKLGVENVYILSAGWGLIRADFLTPKYDITFSQNAEPHKLRRSLNIYRDLNMLPEQFNGELVFFGGLSYLPLLEKLLSGTSCRKKIFHISSRMPKMFGFEFERYEATQSQNWHYECVDWFLKNLT